MFQPDRLTAVLLDHYRRYPGMKIQDFIKLLYQNEFAGGHMIKNEKESLRYLREEYRRSRRAAASADTLFEDIGNDLFRLYIPLLQNGVSLATVNRFFVNTAQDVKGNMESFSAKLAHLKDCVQKGMFSFSIDELEAYLSHYKEKNVLYVHHSERYRTLYSPSYRIVKKIYRDYFSVFCEIDRLLASRDTVTIAIDGKCCAGKTTLARHISRLYDCNVFHTDDFFLPLDLKTDKRLQETGGNIDYERFKREVIGGIKSEKPFSYRAYDCQTKRMRKKICVHPKPLRVVEGSYSLHPAFDGIYDKKIFLDITPQKQAERVCTRNAGPLKEMFFDVWIPMENKYFNGLKIKESCDLVFDLE